MEPKQNQGPRMPVNLSIKNVPDDMAARLRRRAAMAHRSLQGELMAILEEAVEREGRLTPAEALRWVRDRGLETADEATALIRRDRDER
jgi:plasmid stability protein